MNDTQIAFDRFGLGRRPFDHDPADPKAWLGDQLTHYRSAMPGQERLASRTEIAKDMFAHLAPKRGKAAFASPADDASEMSRNPEHVAPDDAAARKAMRVQRGQFARDQYWAQVGLRVRNATATDTPFVEKLVHFWSNHFAVSVDKVTTIPFAGLLEFEAIRPHVLGRFEDMLLAVEQHPAMLLYLDQVRSIGPNSMIGRRGAARSRDVGLNENLGREAMELHTLGVRTGYTQNDVTELARALTGWTIVGDGRGRGAELMGGGGEPGSFRFAPAMHEPGARTILGKTYGQSGEGQARAILTDLAHHPATAQHIATKLARHFVADDPPAPLVAKLQSAFFDSGGDLPTVYRALIDAPEAWAPQPVKFRTPWQWGIALLRGIDTGAPNPLAGMEDGKLARLFAGLGQPVWRPGSPAGFDDIAASWAAGDALFRRVELAGRMAQQLPPNVDPRALAARLFGEGLSAATSQTIAQADSAQQGLALLLVAPEMMRC